MAPCWPEPTGPLYPAVQIKSIIFVCASFSISKYQYFIDAIWAEFGLETYVYLVTVK